MTWSRWPSLIQGFGLGIVLTQTTHLTIGEIRFLGALGAGILLIGMFMEHTLEYVEREKA